MQPGQDGSFVYLIDENSKVKVQPVKVSRQLGAEVVIATGIKAGDRVITEIPQALTPGATVQLAAPKARAARAARARARRAKGKGKEEGAGEAEGATEASRWQSEAEAKAAAK